MVEGNNKKPQLIGHTLESQFTKENSSKHNSKMKTGLTNKEKILYSPP